MVMPMKYSAVAALLLFIGLARAANYTVGGPNGGWDIMTDQKTWASSQTFVVGDNLVFQYSANHDVSEVTKTDYDSCQGTSPVQTYNGGSNVIALAAPGKRYFICSTPGHCSAGMKLEVNTLAGSSAPVPAPASLGPVPTPEPVPAPEPVLGTGPLAPAPAFFGPASAPEPVPGFGPSLSPSPVVSAPEPIPGLGPAPTVSAASPSESSIPSATASNPDIPATEDPTGSFPSTRTSTESPNSAAKTVVFGKGLGGLVIAMILAL